MLMFCLLHEENHLNEKQKQENQTNKQKTEPDRKLAAFGCTAATEKLPKAFGVTTLLIYPGFTWELWRPGSHDNQFKS